jgi:TonB family protein
VAQKAMSPLAAYKSMEFDRSSVREELKDERVASKPIQVSVEFGEISTSGGLSKKTIQKTFKQKLTAIELCYQKALEKKPNIQGEATFQLMIDSKGRVTKVNLVSSKLNDKDLEQCIIQKVKELTFPAPEGSDKVTATVSFNLKTS